MASKLHSAPPFRAEHMGSLLRPDNLLEVRAKIRDTGVSEEEAGLHAVEEKAVRDVVQMQRDLGLKAVSSGEYNRTRFWGLMWDEFEGILSVLAVTACNVLMRTSRYHSSPGCRGLDVQTVPPRCRQSYREGPQSHAR